MDGINLNSVPDELEFYVEAEFVRRKRAKFGEGIISWMASYVKGFSDLAPAINGYVDDLFSGYPEIAEQYRIKTEADKTKDMQDLYDKTFKESDKAPILPPKAAKP